MVRPRKLLFMAIGKCLLKVALAFAVKGLGNELEIAMNMIPRA